MTSDKKMHKLPDFLIVGAMKAGTTTLMDYLVRNSQVTIPDYEVHFFDDNSNFEKGIAWYTTHFESNASTRAIGEKTPTYSYDPKVPPRIANHLPNVKLIWLFRNPVDRAYSNYIHALMRGAERLSFEEAVRQEEELVRKNIFKGYRKRSIYIEQVRRYLDYFSIEKMHFIIFEEFIKNPYLELGKLYKFLGVQSGEQKLKRERKLKSNQSYMPFSRTLQYFSYNFFGDTVVHKGINFINRLASSPPPPLEAELSLALKRFFSDYNKQLADLIDKDLTIWEDR